MGAKRQPWREQLDPAPMVIVCSAAEMTMLTLPASNPAFLALRISVESFCVNMSAIPAAMSAVAKPDNYTKREMYSGEINIRLLRENKFKNTVG